MEQLHGECVADPYRWLEDTDAAEVQAWVTAQNAYSAHHLDGLPLRDAFARRLEAIWDTPRRSLPQIAASGARVFEANSGLQEQPVLYWQASAKAEARALLDPNAMATDPPVSVGEYALSPDGGLLAYTLSQSGSDWRTLRIRRTDTGEDLPTRIERVKFSSLAWTADSRGIFYARYPEAPANADPLFDPLAHQRLRLHRLNEDGADSAGDHLIREAPEHPRRGFSAQTSEDGQWLWIAAWEGTRHNLLFAQPVDATGRATADAIPLVTRLQHDYAVVGHHQETVFVLTDDGAARGRIVAIDLNAPQRRHWRTLVPESTEVLRDARMVGGRLVVHALRDAASVLRVVSLQGETVHSIPLAGLGTVTGLSGRQNQAALHYGFSTTTVPTRSYRVDLSQTPLAPALVHAPPPRFDAASVVTTRAFATSRDGTRIPVLLTHRRDLDLDRTHPTILYGYGGFNIALTPRFSTRAAAWVDAGGIWAVANLRGGGEYGTPWHEAGIRDNKPQTFDDVIAAAGWLIHNGYTRSEQLALHGASNGGMVVGAVVNRRPDLFAAAVPAVGVMDMLRFHRFSIGWAWKPDYGDPEKAEDFAVLRSYSPYHNIAPNTDYPATLITTADHDDRVSPAHSYKYAARLQWAQSGEAPILLRVERKAGHGAGKGTQQRIAEARDVLAFTAQFTGLAPTVSPVRNTSPTNPD
ncbi:prolyl oligopeptidase family serine peptidase [Algiphilus sp.]|uniref:prolyl oligopeptidase family serine peptidase n=1 Tax=Algiphilus sp. TaxID=1872431 RepID=UPI003B51F2C2